LRIKRLIAFLDDGFIGLVVLFLDHRRVLTRLFFLDDRRAAAIAIAIVVTIGANRYTGSYRADANADTRIFRGSGHSQSKPGRRNTSYSEFHGSFLWSLPSQANAERRRQFHRT
jgi:hypothetical protein